ncbi:MAG: hypothetical protein LBQ79_01485 [Deltaproteobacteria bacterium]|jgi:hypothetical protein|nr:hypothetical protein [Deltaproteobacteria bacterium]
MTFRHVTRTVPGALAALALLLLVGSACSKDPKPALPPSAWPGIKHVEVALEKTTREQLVAELGQPSEISLEGGYETLVWTNEKGYIVTFSTPDDSSPHVSHFPSRLEARIAGGVVTFLDAR